MEQSTLGKPAALIAPRQIDWFIV
ncbi:hypothetical protein BCEN4_1320072 [Burkholderia cenocepacia]|nr:hypothetical protein BCEN4_1320072 [Burkholderia cenocepacia]